MKNRFVAGATGIEPISTVLETAILTVVLRPYFVKFFHHFIIKYDKIK